MLQILQCRDDVKQGTEGGRGKGRRRTEGNRED